MQCRMSEAKSPDSFDPSVLGLVIGDRTQTREVEDACIGGLKEDGGGTRQNQRR
jgi:hypothetical protein